MGSRKNWGNRPWEIDFIPTRKELPATVDVAIIGGGFTGLAAAAWLKTLAPEKRVVLFEVRIHRCWFKRSHRGRGIKRNRRWEICPASVMCCAHINRSSKNWKSMAISTLPGVYELGRCERYEELTDSLEGFRRTLRGGKEVPGGTINPGKVVSGLARAAERAGALLFEQAAVREVKFSEANHHCSPLREPREPKTFCLPQTRLLSI